MNDKIVRDGLVDKEKDKTDEKVEAKLSVNASILNYKADSICCHCMRSHTAISVSAIPYDR